MIFLDIDGVLNVVNYDNIESENYTNPLDNNKTTWFFNKNHELAKQWCRNGELLIFMDDSGNMFRSSNTNNLGKLPFLFAFRRDAVNVLNWLLLRYDVSIVISSDWRNHYSIHWLQALFSSNGIKGNIVGLTGECKKYTGYYSLENNRVTEIIDYINLNNVTKYLIIDDMPLHWNALHDITSNFIRTPYYKGLNQENLLEWVKMNQYN